MSVIAELAAATSAAGLVVVVASLTVRSFHVERPSRERDALLRLKREHTPEVPELVALGDVDDGSVPDVDTLRHPTVQDIADALDYFCPGCNRTATRCTVLPVVLVALGEDPPPWS